MPLTPNSKEQVAAQGLERHQRELVQLRKEFQEFVKSDHEIHNEINDTVMETRSVLRSYTLAGKVVWGGVGLVVVAIGSLMGWEVSRVNHLHNEVMQVKSAIIASSATDSATLRSIDNLQEEIRELRRRLAKD